MIIRFKYKEEDVFRLDLSSGAKLSDALTMAMRTEKLSRDLDLTRLHAKRENETVMQNTLLAHGDFITLS
ncbi:MAG: hypothetical protein AAB508_04490 [Patescibacteria group bacterium]